MFKGIITALVTPFKNGEVDFPSLKKLIHFQLENKIDGLVIAGTTGESPTLSKKEKEQIFSFVRAEVSNEVPLILGTGTNSTQESIELSQAAEKQKADGLLVVVPYYNKPPQAGLVAHFSKIAEATDLPLILYNVPSRTITSLTVDSIVSLSQNKKIVGIKEASGDVDFTKQILAKVRKDFFVLSGDDATYLDLYDVGATGVISVISNIIPAQTIAWSKNRKDKKEFLRYLSFIKTLFVEANPIPVKMALHWKKIITTPELRLPLVPLSDSAQKTLRKDMESLGLI